jgi:endonuclease YncB( thermonuclease family)
MKGGMQLVNGTNTSGEYKMNEMNVLRGHSPQNPERHCSDGDSVYLTGSFENTVFRLLGIDALEVRGLSIKKLEASGFLDRLYSHLRKHLSPKLTEKSIELHKELGGEARRFLEHILDDELVMGFGPEVFDRYGRALIMLSKKDTKDTYNVELVRTGYAIPYFIYPNAGGPDEKGEFTYETIKRMRAATLKAQNMNLGIWEHIENILIPMELRFLTRREFPAKYCADLGHDFLYPPHYYFKVPISDRLFFYPDDILAAIKMEFRPIPACYQWVHKIWKDYHGKKSWEEGGELGEREKRHESLGE